MKRTPLTRGVLVAAVAGLTLALERLRLGRSRRQQRVLQHGQQRERERRAHRRGALRPAVRRGLRRRPRRGPGQSSPRWRHEPVVTALSTNPALSTVVQAVTAANLADSINTLQDITVLVPANTAFEAIPAERSRRCWPTAPS